MKKIIRRLLQKFNYDIVKVNEFNYKNAQKVVSVKLGKYYVNMPGNNPQISNYKHIPDMNYQLGRLSKIVSNKYSDCTIIDVGANVGDTIAIIKNYTNAKVIGVEGDDASYKFLAENTKQFSNVVLIKQFLSETNNSIKADLEKEGWNGTIVPNSSGTREIIFKTLDQTLIDENLYTNNIRVLKTDVEGYDTIVLRGSTEILQKHKPVIFFEYNRSNMSNLNEDGFSTLLSFKNYGYNTAAIFDNKGKFLLSTSLSNEKLLLELHNYADGKNGMIGYFDIGLFHINDEDIAMQFIEEELKLAVII